MKQITIQQMQGRQAIDISVLQKILHGSGIRFSLIKSEFHVDIQLKDVGGIRFFADGFPVSEPPADLLVFHAKELGYPIHSSFEILALIDNGANQEQTSRARIESSLVIVAAKKSGVPLSEHFRLHDLRQDLAKVFLVGAGTGKDMLTLSALKALQSADIIFYDNLVSQDIMEEIRAKKIFVGKRAGDHCMSQAEINEMVYGASFENKAIVRLKGGDPCIYGHAGEEVAYLESHFVPVQIVPGISSAQAAAAVSLTPLTMRGISKSVAFCSGHEKTNIQVPDTDTLVYYMGANNLKKIAKELVVNNFPLSAPIRLVYNIGATNEEIYDETIESVLNSENRYKSPLIVIVGNVADKSNWWKAFLEKKRILYTGTHINNYADLGYVTHHPMIKLISMPDTSIVDQAVSSLKKYDFIVFTSAYAVKFFFERVYANGFDSRIFSGIKIVSIGAHTTSKLGKHGIVPDYQPDNESSEGIVELFLSEKIQNCRILLPRSDKALSFLPGQLEKSGNIVEPLKVYTNVMPENINKLNPESFDQVIFSSPSCVENFIQVYGSLPQKPELICKGKETLKSLTKFGYTAK